MLTDMVQNNCCEVWQYIYNWENALEVLNECEVKELCESVKTRLTAAIANVCQIEKLCNVVVKYLMRKIHKEANRLAISVNSVSTLKYHKNACYA